MSATKEQAATYIVVVIDGEIDTYATVAGTVEGGRITTHGDGTPNVTHYTATIGGHEVEAAWYDDARHKITAHITPDHPLADAVRLIGAKQRVYADIQQMPGVVRRPTGYTRIQWHDVLSDVREQLRRAEAAVQSHQLAAAISPRFDV